MSTSTSRRAAIDYNFGGGTQLFARYTFDDTDQFLPTDYPQFPRNFISRNQFFTSEYRRIVSPNTVSISRIGFSRTRIGQNVQANTSQPLPTFVATRDSMGDIDIGGLRRFGPQSSGNLRLVQNVFSAQSDLIQTRGRHVLKAGALAEHYQDNMVNPTFSLGIFTFADLSAFLGARAASFVGLTPEAQFDRYWRFTLFGFYLQDDFRVSPRVTVNAGLRYEFTTLPEEKYNRDSALPDLSASAPVVGPLYENPTFTNLSPRLGVAWDVFGNGRTAVRGGYGLYFNTNNHQNLIVTVTNPPFTPRPVIANPTFPNPPFDRASAISMRPVQYDLDNPRVHIYNANVQQEVWGRTAVTIGYAGSRGLHLLRSGDVNLAQPAGTTADGRPFIAAGTPRMNPSFSTIELKSSDGDSWYNALHLRSAPALEPGPFAAVVLYVLQERGHHAGLDVLLRCDQRHHLGAARVHARLQPGTVRLRHPPQLGHELHRGTARAGHDRRGRRDSRRLESLRDLDDAQRQSADGVRDHQSLALTVESVARTRHRSGSARLRARVWARQRRARPARAMVRPGGLQAPARRHVWQHGPR